MNGSALRRTTLLGVAGFLTAAAGCRLQETEPRAATAAPAEAGAGAARAPERSLGMEVYRGDGFTLRYPSGARIQPVEELHGARSGVRVLGPEIGIRPAEGEFTWHGAAYALEVGSHDNPERLDARAWGARHVARTEARVREEGDAEVAGYPAYRIVGFGGDSEWVTLVVTHDDRAYTLIFNDIPVQNFPAAPAARDLHALLLSTFALTP